MYEACATHGCRYDVEAVQRAVALGSNVKVLYDIGERELHLLACPECTNPVAVFLRQEGGCCGYCGAYFDVPGRAARRRARALAP
jgi:hypothetical protein